MTPWREVEVPGTVGTVPVTAVVVGTDERVLLVRDDDGRLAATAPGCPHLGNPLAGGEVVDGVLECPHHAYRYRLDDGVCVGPPSPLTGRLVVHEVREHDGRVEVRLATPA